MTSQSRCSIVGRLDLLITVVANRLIFVLFFACLQTFASKLEDPSSSRLCTTSSSAWEPVSSIDWEVGRAVFLSRSLETRSRFSLEWWTIVILQLSMKDLFAYGRTKPHRNGLCMNYLAAERLTDLFRSKRLCTSFDIGVTRHNCLSVCRWVNEGFKGTVCIHKLNEQANYQQ